MKPFFLTQKEIALLANRSEGWVSRRITLDGDFLGVPSITISRTRLWHRRAIEVALGLANEETPKDATKEPRVRDAPEEPTPKVTGKWRTRTRTASRWGEAERVYRVADAVD